MDDILQPKAVALSPGIQNAYGIRTRLASPPATDGGIIDALWEALHGGKVIWVDTVRLSETFYRALKDHPVPIAEPALRHIANQSMAIDVYIWLAYRLHSLTQPTPLSWAALFNQFGAGYQHLRQFKSRFLDPLKAALAVYPDARVEVDDNGLTLHPSRPPVLERQYRLI